MSVSASPLITRQALLRRASALFTEPALPSGDCWMANVKVLHVELVTVPEVGPNHGGQELDGQHHLVEA